VDGAIVMKHAMGNYQTSRHQNILLALHLTAYGTEGFFTLNLGMQAIATPILQMKPICLTILGTSMGSWETTH